MIIKALKTSRIRAGGPDIFEVLDKYLDSFENNSILAITSKIISLCQGRIENFADTDIEELVQRESEFYLTKSDHITRFTITQNTLIPRAGIDTNKKQGYYILWPEKPQQIANDIKKYLNKRFSTSNAGVIITDSTSMPLRRGVTGICIAYSGFKPLNDYKSSRANIAGGLAAAAVTVMGEGAELTPLATISDLPFVSFEDSDPTEQELKDYFVSMDEDLFADLLKGVDWQKGQG
jgi:F420-0:gamma-glutamyl ligase